MDWRLPTAESGFARCYRNKKQGRPYISCRPQVEKDGDRLSSAKLAQLSWPGSRVAVFRAHLPREEPSMRGARITWTLSESNRSKPGQLSDEEQRARDPLPMIPQHLEGRTAVGAGFQVSVLCVLDFRTPIASQGCLLQDTRPLQIQQ